MNSRNVIGRNLSMVIPLLASEDLTPSMVIPLLANQNLTPMVMAVEPTLVPK